MRKISVIGLFVALFATSIFAQLTTSNLIGTVIGPDGVVPGAIIVVTSSETGKEVSVVSDGQGGFKVPNLQLGIYNVKVSATGFKTFTAEAVQIEVGKDYSLEATLEIGQITENVTVIAGADVVNSTDAQLNGIVNQQQLINLPTLDRDPLRFINFQAGVNNNPNQPATINGIRTSSTNITIEGINVQDALIRTNATEFAPGRPSVEEVQEFSVTSQSNVDNGFGAGQIQFAIRRGTNTFNGSAFIFNRNSEFGANSFFNNRSGIERPFRNKNEFGGRLGGPIIKDKVFFFGFFQRIIDINPTNQLITTLTPQARQGLFTYNAATSDPTRGVTAGQLVTVNLLNPTLNTGITSINPLIQQRFISRLQNGNSIDTGDGRVTTGYRFNSNFNERSYNVTGRVDYVINDKNTVYGLYRFVKQNLNRADIDTVNPIPTVTQGSANKQFSASHVFTPTANFSNQFQGGFFFSDPAFIRNEQAPANFIIPTLVTNPEITFLNQGRIPDTYNFQDNATYTIGKHSLRFGGQYQSTKLDITNDGGIVPTYNLGINVNTPQITPGQFTNNALFPGGVPVAQRAAANNLVALLGGIVSSASQTFNADSVDSGFVSGATNRRILKNDILGLYITDQFRITSDLTINAGIRYDYYTPLRSTDGIFLEPAIADGSSVLEAILNPNGTYQPIGGNNGNGRFSRPDRNNFGPSISIAYNPKNPTGIFKTVFGEGKTVFRAGYKNSYINDELVAAPRNALLGNQGFSLTNNAFNPITGTVDINERVDNLPTISAPLFSANRTYLQNNLIAGRFGTVFAVDPELQAPRIQEFNVGVQRELGFDTVLEVRYVGNRSNNLTRVLDFNQVDIRSNGFLADFNRARQNIFLTGNPSCTVAQNAGCQTLTVFPLLGGGGLLTNPTVQNNIINGTPADLAIIYVQNNLTNGFRFLPNPNTGVANILGNFGRSQYDGLQVELRRRFVNGLQLQANYTFSKSLTNSQGALTDAPGDTQSRVEANLDNLQPELENARALTDQTHVFNLNAVYELPFGKDKRFLNSSGIVNYLFGGFSINPVVRLASGAPISFVDPRGTLNRSTGNRSNRQTALTSLSGDELRDLIGIYRTPNGVFFINPSALGRNPDGSLQTGRDGRGIASPDPRVAPFQGQVFFNNAPGQTGSLGRTIFNGPTFFTVDASLIKRFSFRERYAFQVQLDAFNLFNRTNFTPVQSLNINSATFGQITTTTDPRIVQVAARFSF